MNLGPTWEILLYSVVFASFCCNLVLNQSKESKPRVRDKIDPTICEGKVNLCANGGKCVPNKSRRGYRCDCAEKYVGDKCQNVNFCRSLPCQNKGECINKRTTFRCRCEKPYIGKTCDQIRINNCESLPCLNGGECISNNEGFNCKCPPLYTGEYCEEVSDIEERCLNITENLHPKCCTILNKCCLDDPRDFVCGSWEDGKNPVLFYNKCELRKARCLNPNQCFLKRNTTSCEGDHVDIMTRPTPCEYCPCEEMHTMNYTLQDLVAMRNVREKLSANCTVENCSNGPPPDIPYCLKEAAKLLVPKSIWDTL